MLKSIQTKILLGFMLVIVMMGILGAWAIGTLSSLGNANRLEFQQKLKVVQGLAKLDTALVELRSASTRLIFYTTDSRAGLRFTRAIAETYRVLDEVSQGNTTLQESPTVQQGISDIRYRTTFLLGELVGQLGPDSVSKNLKEKGEEARRLSQQRESAEVFTSELDPVFDEVKDRIGALQQAYIRDLAGVVASGVDRAREIEVKVFGLGIAVIFLFVLFSFRFSKVIVTPIQELTEKVKEISAGELTQVIVPRTKDELGMLAEQFNEMARKLAEYEELNLKKILEEKAISESIVQSMNDGLMLIDRSGTILSINLKAQELFALTDVEGLTCSEVGKDSAALTTLSAAALAGTWEEKDRMSVVEHTMDGEVRYLRRDITPIYSSSSSERVAFLLIFRDVTKEFEMEKMRTEFVGMVSHELRTPLTAIRMSVDLLAEAADTQAGSFQAELVGAIKEESERLLRIVNDLMDLARFQGGMFKVRPRRVDLNKFFEQGLVSVQGSAAEVGVKLAVSIDPGIRYAILDPDRIKQVFVNLVSNALRYTPRGGEVTVGARRGLLTDEVEYFVRDTGAGIPAEFLPRIFERFAIISSDAKSGTGLGLAIVKEIVTAHGGTINVRSTVGKGTEFWFTLSNANSFEQLTKTI